MTPFSSLKLGIIGLGNMGKYHVNTLLELGLSVAGVCDANPELVKKVALQCDCPGYVSVSEFLDKVSLDAVAIVLPTFLHYDVAMACMAKGLHVFIEKPIASHVSQAEDMGAYAAAHDLVLMVGHIERFNPAVQSLMAYVQKGALGDLVSFSSRRESPMPLQIKDANVLLDLAVHDLDIALALMGTPVSVQRHSFSVHLPDRDDYASLVLSYPKGLAHIQVNWVSQLKTRQLFLLGTKGSVTLDYLNQTVQVFHEDDSLFLPVQAQKPLTLEWQHFLFCIDQKTQPLVNAKAGVAVLKLIA